MKKKLKDLTVKEMVDLCQSINQCKHKCPFYKYDNCLFLDDIKEDLEMEIEVNE